MLERSAGDSTVSLVNVNVGFYWMDMKALVLVLHAIPESCGVKFKVMGEEVLCSSVSECP